MAGYRQNQRRIHIRKRKFRAIAALILTLALVLSVRIPTLAAEPQAHDHAHADAAICTDASGGAAPMSSCTVHVWQSMSILVPGGSIYVSVNCCKTYWRAVNQCTKCRVIEYGEYYYVPNDFHDVVVYSSSCNGRTQTWQNKCRQCLHTLPATTMTCPGGPHTGMCRWLPT